MTRYFLLVLLLAGCAMPAGPRTVLMKDGFLVIVVADTASADKVCDRLSGGFTLPSGGCYVADRDIGVVVQGDSISIRHELCHHRDLQHRGKPGWISELDCTERWHYRE